MTFSVNSMQLKSDSRGSYLDSGIYHDYTIFDQVSVKIYTYTPSKVSNWAFRFSKS
ncbi:hypothetical protein PanWU01x14_162120 [Parasponia andersonii]|uniref:Uncharacterized protein n=1 Tax=Parasponia andersonii TaxID=3476 RepID=A0A2P5CDF0_PARAD|nr:hypothetical protein PanWU01x14_162120 [Parasponia andersonii]